MKLWFDNDEGFDSVVNDRVAEIFATNELEDFATAKREIADWLEEFIAELFDFDSIFENRSLFTMMQDIGSTYRVNWYEIADAFYIEYTDNSEA